MVVQVLLHVTVVVAFALTFRHRHPRAPAVVEDVTLL